MDFTLTPEQTSFRDEVRGWLAKNMKQDWVARLSQGSDIPRPEAYEMLRAVAADRCTRPASSG